MKVKNIYPPRKNRKKTRVDVINYAKWPFLIAAYVCPIVNICTGGTAWSVIVLWSLYIVWTAIFYPDLIEYNRISQFIKLIINCCILFILIDILLAYGTANAFTVVPIVCFASLIITGVLFLTDIERQKHNMMPMFIMITISLIASGVGFAFWNKFGGWEIIVMASVSVALLIVCIYILKGEMKNELKKILHTK